MINMAREKEIANMLSDESDFNVNQVKQSAINAGKMSDKYSKEVSGSNASDSLIRNIY